MILVLVNSFIRGWKWWFFFYFYNSFYIYQLITFMRRREEKQEICLINCSFWKGKVNNYLELSLFRLRIRWKMVFCLFCFVFGFLFFEYHFIDLQICIVSMFHPIAFILFEAQIYPPLSHKTPFKLALFLAQQVFPGSFLHPDSKSAIFLRSPRNQNLLARGTHCPWIVSVSKLPQWIKVGGNKHVYIFKSYVHIEISNSN